MNYTVNNEAYSLYIRHLLSEYQNLPDGNIDIKINVSEKEVSVTAIFKEIISKTVEEFQFHSSTRLAVTCAIGKSIIEILNVLGFNKPHYGVLTGVRPQKVAISLLANNSYDNTVKLLCERYLVSKDKANTLCNTVKYDIDIRKEHKPTDVSLYVSIPFCPSRCNYCSFISSAAPSMLNLLDKYIEILLEEMSISAKVISDNNLSIKSIYIGGGTPTVLNESQLYLLISNIRKYFHGNYEFTVEAGRPDTVTKEKLDILKDFSTDRISINTQSTNNDVLKSIGRNHTYQDFCKAYELAKSTGFKTVNTDIIAGLDNDSIDTFIKTVNDIIALCPENISVHPLCLKKSSSIKINNTFNESKNIDKYISYSLNSCINTGYVPYYLYRQKYTLGNQENIGYSKPGHICYYNVSMMNEIDNIIGLGAGATSRIVGDKNTHLANYKYPTEYMRDKDKFIDNLNTISNMLQLHKGE